MRPLPRSSRAVATALRLVRAAARRAGNAPAGGRRGGVRPLLPLLALHALLAAPAALEAQLAVDNLELFVAPARSGPTNTAFTVTNRSTAPVEARVYANDWYRAVDGSNRFIHPDSATHAGRCGERLQLFPSALRLDPGAEATVRITLTGVDSLRASSCWAIVFVETVPPPRLAGARQVTYNVRTGVKVYVEPPGLAPTGEVVRMEVVPERVDSATRARGDDARRLIEVDFRNTGGAQLRYHGSIELRTPGNAVVERLEVPALAVLPGAVRRVALRVPAGLAPGRYAVLALLDYGGAELAAGQIELEVP